MGRFNSKAGLTQRLTEMDVSKLKVADLKKELKARGLNTSGTKNELVERLQESSHDESADVLDNDDLLDEDAVLAVSTQLLIFLSSIFESNIVFPG